MQAVNGSLSGKCYHCHAEDAHAVGCFAVFQRGLMRARPGLARIINFRTAERIERLYAKSSNPSTRGRQVLEYVDELLAAQTTDRFAASPHGQPQLTA